MAPPIWTTACPDWEDRIIRGLSIVPTPPLFPDEAARAMQVFKELRIVDAAGSPMLGDSCRPWMIEFAEAIFGAYDGESGKRLIREFFLLISKKNGKSSIAAAVMITALVLNWRQSAEFLIVAPTLEVANNSFFAARDMVRADDELAEILQVQDHLKTITHRVTNATLKVISADSDTVSGKKATGVLIDELWAFGKRANAENMLREATGGLASRPEGFIVYLSTQSDEPPAGVFKQKLNYFRNVRDGKIQDPRSMPLIFEFPQALLANEGYLRPDSFHITNPNIGLSVDPEFLSDKLTEAQLSGGASLRGFLAKHLNVEIGDSLRDDGWAGAQFWAAAADKRLTLDAVLERSEVVVAGIDGGGLDDLFGLAVIGREKKTKRWLAWAHAWAGEVVFDRRKSIASSLRDFERDGDLTVIARAGDDLSGVVDVIARLVAAELLPEKEAVGLDPFGVGAVVDALAEIGVGDGRAAAVSQGYRLQGAVKTVERKLADGTLIHGGAALMSWCAGNAKTEMKGNAMLVTKAAAGTAKIDPLMALFNAASLMSLNPEAARSRSIYEERPLRLMRA